MKGACKTAIMRELWEGGGVSGGRRVVSGLMVAEVQPYAASQAWRTQIIALGRKVVEVRHSLERQLNLDG
jgi:hypothetical protein